MYVGGCGLEEEAGSESMKEGLTAWRILSDYPHYKLVTDYSDDLRQVNWPEETNNLVSNQVRHKPGCTASEAG